MGCSRSQEKRTDGDEFPENEEPNQEGECGSPRAPRPVKQSRADPNSPRAPRPGHQQIELSDLEDDESDTAAVDTSKFLTQVSRGPPSPGMIASPRSESIYQGQVLQGQGLLPAPIAADEGKLCLCLDLDECLVHAEREEPDHYDHVIDVTIAAFGTFQIFFTKRPGLDKFLDYVSERFELVLFTASMEEYARAVLAKIDPTGKIKHVLARKQCTFHEKQYYVKDLSRLGRPIRDVMLLDDNPNAYLFQPQNAIPINSWYDDIQDKQLADVQHLLDIILKAERSPVTTLEQMDSTLKWDRTRLHMTRKFVRLS